MLVVALLSLAACGGGNRAAYEASETATPAPQTTSSTSTPENRHAHPRGHPPRPLHRRARHRRRSRLAPSQLRPHGQSCDLHLDHHLRERRQHSRRHGVTNSPLEGPSALSRQPPSSSGPPSTWATSRPTSTPSTSSPATAAGSSTTSQWVYGPSGVAVSGGCVFSNLGGHSIAAYRALDGELVWDTNILANGGAVNFQPLVVGGTVFAATSSLSQPGARGALYALDPSTGEIRWSLQHHRLRGRLGEPGDQQRRRRLVPARPRPRGRRLLLGHLQPLPLPRRARLPPRREPPRRQPLDRLHPRRRYRHRRAALGRSAHPPRYLRPRRRPHRHRHPRRRQPGHHQHGQARPRHRPRPRRRRPLGHARRHPPERRPHRVRGRDRGASR